MYRNIGTWIYIYVLYFTYTKCIQNAGRDKGYDKYERIA